MDPPEDERSFNILLRTYYSWLPKRRKGDDAEFEEGYQKWRITTAYNFLPKLQMVMWVVAFLISLLSFMGGNFDPQDAAISVLPPTLMLLAIAAARAPLLAGQVNKNFRLWGNSLQIASFVMNVLLRSVTTVWQLEREMGNHVHQHRVTCIYLVSVFIVVLVDALGGYVPDNIYYLVYPPCLAFSWAYFHHQVGGLDESTCVMGLGLVGLGIWLRLWADAMNRECLEMYSDLKKTRDSLDEVLSAQQRLMSGFFDASCVCDSRGRVTQAAPQMSELLACNKDKLPGNMLQSWVPPSEASRLSRFLEDAWEHGVGQTRMIQTIFKRQAIGANLAAQVATKDEVDVTIYCIKLPTASRASESMQLWAHGGLFLGVQEVAAPEVNLQEVADKAISSRNPSSTGSSSSESAEVEAVAKVADSHSIIFDADTENFEVMSCSAVFVAAGFGKGGCCLRYLLPEEAAKTLDDLVYDTVQNAPEGQFYRSPALASLSFQLPGVAGARLACSRAWLEVQHAPTEDGATPIVLRVSGVRMKAGKVLGGTPTLSAPLESIQELADNADPCSQLILQADLQTDSKCSDSPPVPDTPSTLQPYSHKLHSGSSDDCSDETGTLGPDDSVSQAGSRVRFVPG